MFSGGNVTVYVSDIDRGVRFYNETLELKVPVRGSLGFCRSGKGFDHLSASGLDAEARGPKRVDGDRTGTNRLHSGRDQSRARASIRERGPSPQSEDVGSYRW
jgi:catechol 2,3-dioxygenase-like lactoylglutathione lyase family enzyme